MVIPNTCPNLSNIVHTDFELGRVIQTVGAADPGITASPIDRVVVAGRHAVHPRLTGSHNVLKLKGVFEQGPDVVSLIHLPFGGAFGPPHPARSIDRSCQDQTE